MKILKKLFGGDTKIHVDEVADSQGRLLGESVIVEKGENANGSYILFGNGVLICYAKMDVGAPNVSMGSIYSSSSKQWVFPKEFAAPPVVTSQPILNVGRLWTGLGQSGTTGSQTSIIVFSPVSSATIIFCGMMAIGIAK